jgi:hypothetical protein
VIGNQLFVTYALQDADRLHPVIGAGNGLIDVFDLAGNFVKRFASNGRLNAPWSVTKASANFGAFSNDILIGNFGDGTINVFDTASGEFLGTLKDGAGNPIVNPGLHGMVFGSGATGDLHTLYLAAGLAAGQVGAFGAIAVNTGAGAPDFSVATSSGCASLALGQSATFSFTATPMAGFLGRVTFSCSAPAGITCGFNPASVPTGAQPGSTTLTVIRSASAMQQSPLAVLAVPGFLLTGFGAIGAGISRRKKTKRILGWIGKDIFSLVIFALLLVVGACAGCGGAYMQAGPQTASITVTAQSGSIVHTSMVTVTLQ